MGIYLLLQTSTEEPSLTLHIDPSSATTFPTSKLDQINESRLPCVATLKESPEQYLALKIYYSRDQPMRNAPPVLGKKSNVKHVRILEPKPTIQL